LSDIEVASNNRAAKLDPLRTGDFEWGRENAGTRFRKWTKEEF